MTAVVPLLAEALNLAITERWDELLMLGYRRREAGALVAGWPGRTGIAAEHDDAYSAGVEALAVALHARLQEQGTLG